MSPVEPELVRPYGDRRDDGMVQLSFVLPLQAGERAREAAAEVARRMGLEQVHVAGPAERPTAPGQLRRHYATRTPLRVLAGPAAPAPRPPRPVPAPGSS